MRFSRNRPVLFSQSTSAVGEPQRVEVIQRLLEPGSDEEATARRQVAEEKFKYSGFRLSMVQIGLDHVDLVEVGQ